jgi:alkylated DNA repair dioxygenase AlkB
MSNPFETIENESRRWVVDDDGIELDYDADFLAPHDADRLFQALKTEIDWRRVVVQTPAGPKTVPRMISWHADEGLTYAYSGLVHQWQPWTPALAELRGRIVQRLGVPFNGCLANLYENERDSVAMHADDESDMAPGAPIASVSLGEVREFVVRHLVSRRKHVLPLGHGSLVVMKGDTQKVSRHGVPKAKRSCGPRINLTFRVTLPGEP